MSDKEPIKTSTDIYSFTEAELTELQDPRVFAAMQIKLLKEQNELLKTMDWKLWEILLETRKQNRNEKGQE